MTLHAHIFADISINNFLFNKKCSSNVSTYSTCVKFQDHSFTLQK